MTSGDRPDDPDFDDKDLFGIDLGHRGVRNDDTDRDQVEEPPPPARTARTLSDRLASAKADRELDEEDDRRRRAREDEDEGADDADPAE